MRPEFTFAYAGSFPDNIKVKKSVSVWPLRLSASAKLQVATGHITPKVSCKDVFIKGKLSLEVDGDSKSLQYRKRLHLPLVGGLGCLVAAVKWDLSSNTNADWRPKFRIGMELTQGTQMMQPNVIQWRMHLPVSKNIGVQAKTCVGITPPRQLMFNFSSPLPEFGDDGGNLKIHLDVKQLNLVLKL